MMILESKNIKFTVVDITEPTQDKEKDFMMANATEKGVTVSDADPRHPLPPQIFNGSEYCGDYNSFELANECDTLEQFLKLEVQNGSSAPAAVAPTPAETNGKNGVADTETTAAPDADTAADTAEETVVADDAPAAAAEETNTEPTTDAPASDAPASEATAEASGDGGSGGDAGDGGSGATD